MTTPRSAKAKLTWFVSSAWNVLHHLPEADPAGEWWEETTDGGKSGVAACGLWTTFYAPGVLTRLGAPRCKRCCRRAGVPEGKGSNFP